MTEQPVSVIKSTSRLLVQHARDAYQHEAEDWRDIDRKAQGVVAICGIFITAAALSLRNLPSFTFIGHLALFALVVVVLIGAWWAISALRIAKIEHGVERTSDVIDRAKEIIFEDDSDSAAAQQRIRQFVLDRAEAWSKAREALESVNHKKADLILSAQDCLSCTVPILYMVVADAVIKAVAEASLLRVLLWVLALCGLYLLRRRVGEPPAA
jgi:transcriptional accessory protein Tex/SPT6